MQTRFTRRTRLLSWLLTLAMLLSIAPVSAFAATGDVAINEANFPDENFRNYVQEAFDDDGNGALDSDEIAAVTTIDCGFKNISNLKGIEYFTELTELNANGNALTTLDLSKNTALTDLYVSGNALTTLDLSKNTALMGLDVSSNQLATLDLSQNTALVELDVSYNALAALDVKQNTALTYLDVNNNDLAALDVSKNTDLEALHCDNNQLTGLNVDNNAALMVLGCSTNKLKALNLSNNPELVSLSCYSNELTALDVSSNASLAYLMCNWNQLSKLDVSKNPSMGDLSCDYNQLTTLDVSQNGMLMALYCNHNALTTLKLGEKAYLEELRCEYNALTELDVSQSSVLNTLFCNNNQLTSLKLNSALECLDCGNNQLTVLDVSPCNALEFLYCNNNQLTSLDLSQNPNLMEKHYSNADNLYSIQLKADNTFDLSTLPGKFDVSRASNWQGGSVSGNTLTVNPGVTTVTYTYQCSDTLSSDFALKISGSAPAPTSYTAYWVAHEGDQPIASVQVPGAIGDAEEKVRFVGWYTADGTRLEDTPYFTTENGGPHIEVDKLTQDVTFYARWCTESELQTLNFTDCTVTINPEMTVFGRRDDLTSPAKVAPGARVVLTMDKSKADEGMKFAITPAPADWNDNGTTATFTMPEQEVTVKVGTSVTPDPDNPDKPNPDTPDKPDPDNPDQPGPDTPAQQHTLTFEDCTVEVTSASSGDSTTYTASPIQVAKGDRVTLKLDETKIPEGMKFNGFVIDPIPAPDEMTTDGTTVTFTMPDENTTVRVNFCTESEDSSLDFGTVVAGTAVAGAVGFVAYQVGTEVILDQLLPEGVAVPRTRAELALLLWNTAGSPAPAAAPAFVDVEDPALANAAQWALEQGYLNAREDGSFAPEKRVAKWRVIKALKAASHNSTTAQ